MRQSGFTGGSAGRAVNVQAAPTPRNSSNRPRERELELKLAALQEDYADLHAALFDAAQVHRRLCAPRLVRRGDFEIASEIFAVRHLPGDFFTVVDAGGSVILALGDVCGHGLAAGMWTTHLVGLVGMHTAASATGTLDYCSAGHPPALLLRADGQLESLSEGGPLLGVLPAASFARGRLQLRAGDVLLACSDGILESRNSSDQEFGYERLEAQLRRAPTGSADGVLFSVLGAVQDFAVASELADDTSLVVVRRSNPQGNA